MTEILARVDDPALGAFTSTSYTSLEQLLSVDAKELRAVHGVGQKTIRILARSRTTPDVAPNRL